MREVASCARWHGPLPLAFIRKKKKRKKGIEKGVFIDRRRPYKYIIW